MGAVFEAEHGALGRTVALKVLLAPDDPGLVARFEREVEACGRLDHPNLIRVHGSGVAGRLCYLSMELVQGESLQEVLDRSGPLAPDLALARVSEAAAGIAHAHAHGVLHRDLKPANLLWDEEHQRVRVVDFGLTGGLRATDSLTVTGEVLGTLGYLSPEQAVGEAGAAGPACDVYGLGATLFALLTGRPPFLGRGLAGLAEVAHQPAPDLRALRAEVSPKLARFVAACLHKDPAQRPPTPAAFLEALAEAESPSRRGRAFVAMAAIALACLLGAAGLWRVEESRREATLLEGYVAWRAEQLEPFLYGWGPAGSSLESGLEDWEGRLRPLSESPPQAQALAELRAHRRILLARRGRDPGPPPTSQEEDRLAQAILDLDAGRHEAATRGLQSIRGQLGSSEAVAQTRLAASAHTRSVLRGLLERVRGVELRRLDRAFPGALESLAPDLSAKELTVLIRLAELRGLSSWSRALRGALEASAALRREELVAARGREGLYLSALCVPLRRGGLWPGPKLVEACRADFLLVVEGIGESVSEAQRIALAHYEHELFYRVDPRPTPSVRFRGALLGIEGASTGVPDEAADRNRWILLRSRARYGVVSYDRLMERGSKSRLSRILARAPEPSGRLDRAWKLAVKHWGLESPLPPSELPGFQRELTRALSEGLDDLAPEVAAELIEIALQAWRTKWSESKDLVFEGDRLGWLEFERSLNWQLAFPANRFARGVAAGVELAGHACFGGGQPERALERFTRAIEIVRAAKASAPDGLRRNLAEGERELYARFGLVASFWGAEVTALPLLEQGLKIIEDSLSRWSQEQVWAAMLAAYLSTEDWEQAFALKDRIKDRHGPDSVWALTRAMVRTYVAEKEVERAQSCLDAAVEYFEQEAPDSEVRTALRGLASVRKELALR